MLSFVPGRLIEHKNEAFTSATSGCITAAAYLYLSFGWMGFYEVKSWKLYFSAFMVGQSIALAKTACLSVTIRSLDATLDVGKGVGLVIGCLEYGNCLYTQVTEIWCGSGTNTASCDYGIPGKGAVGVRHLFTAVVALILSPAMYRPVTTPKDAPPPAATCFAGTGD